MKRRDFITKAGIGGAGYVAATTLAAPAVAQERIEMAIVATQGRDFPGLELVLRDMLKKFKIYRTGVSK